MSYASIWKKKQLEDLAKQSYKSKSQAQAAANLQYGSGTTQSGQFASAAGAIDREEGAAASGISEIAAENERMAAEEKRRYENERKDAQKAQKWSIVQGLLGVGLGLATGNVGGAIAGGVKSLVGAAAPKASAVPPAEQQAFAQRTGIGLQPEAAATPTGTLSDQLSQTLQPDYLNNKMYQAFKKRKAYQPYSQYSK